ncbi:RidA family protein [Paenibacillus daejeonensis]|uniref:RidA family protein n=1 Tax=Paenibacillus daejeonensis TaxID=135193 RepID=UPI00037C5872|nr:RidA family protein [Paenibacillus daejeonensis]
MSTIEQRLAELGIVLPEPPPPVAKYIPAVTTGNLVYTSGADCRIDGTLMYRGKLGDEITMEMGQAAARQTALNLLAILRQHLGDLDRIERMVKMLGFVNSAPGFNEQPAVINGASELFIDVFGECGRHARSAVGTNELPFDTPVEIELIVAFRV